MKRFFERLLCSPLKGMQQSRSVGLECLVLYALILLRAVSFQYWLLAFFPDDDASQRKRRDIAVDISVVVQCIAVVFLWRLVPSSWLGPARTLAVYLLFCLYLSLLNILFFSAMPSVNRPSTSAARSLVLLIINLLQVTFTFALFYRAELCLSPAAALFGSFLVLGTIGTPESAATANTAIVPLHILCNFVLLAVAVAVFVNQVRMRLSNDASGGTSGTA